MVLKDHASPSALSASIRYALQLAQNGMPQSAESETGKEEKRREKKRKEWMRRLLRTHSPPSSLSAFCSQAARVGGLAKTRVWRERLLPSAVAQVVGAIAPEPPLTLLGGLLCTHTHHDLLGPGDQDSESKPLPRCDSIPSHRVCVAHAAV